jgi:hypothetical protein
MAKERPLILDDDEPPAPKRNVEVREAPRFGFEWGLASTIIGATLLIAGPMALLFCLVFWSGGRVEHGLSSSETNLAHVAGVVIGAGAILLSMLGIYFGGRGLGRARQAHHPAALPVCGMLLCFGALIVWIIIGVDWVMIMDSFRGRSSAYY